MEKYLGLSLLFLAVFGFTYHYSERFLDWLRFQSIGTRDYVVEKLSLMYIDIPAHRIVLFHGLFAIVPALIAFLLCLPNWGVGIVFGIIGCVLGWKAPKPVVDYLYSRRVMKFSIQMVDALGLMSNGMKSGLSIAQSMGLVVREMPNPIKQEFEMILNQNKLGVSLEEAFNNLSKRVLSDDVEMFVTAVNTLKETGGNLAETFDTIVSTIRERIKVENRISAITAQGFYQGLVVMAIVPAMAVINYQADPEYMAPLFNTTIGLMLIALVVVLEVVGFFLILRIVKIDV